MAEKPQIVALTGAGISAESGLQTFRGADGLWEGHRIEEVATPEAWVRDHERVLQFYNRRRQQLREAQPNAGHRALAELAKTHPVSIITQNIDDLHERAGSPHVLHLHGQLRQARPENDDSPAAIIDLGDRDIYPGDTAANGAQLRPNVVWFGEHVPAMREASSLVGRADILLIIGTSLAVYPAAFLAEDAPGHARRYLINPETPEHLPLDGIRCIEKPATTGIPEICALIQGMD